ncbi:hypothetical protein C8Q76DRAFT_697888 [Earliella scabrosa]|nr:hypothetical protein C8Q76DRAFT_697888 [Earliella scabrosa]
MDDPRTPTRGRVNPPELAVELACNPLELRPHRNVFMIHLLIIQVALSSYTSLHAALNSCRTPSRARSGETCCLGRVLNNLREARRRPRCATWAGVQSMALTQTEQDYAKTVDGLVVPPPDPGEGGRAQSTATGLHVGGDVCPSPIGALFGSITARGDGCRRELGRVHPLCRLVGCSDALPIVVGLHVGRVSCGIVKRAQRERATLHLPLPIRIGH